MGGLVPARPLEAHLDWGNLEVTLGSLQCGSEHCPMRGITAVAKRGYAWSLIVFGM